MSFTFAIAGPDLPESDDEAREAISRMAQTDVNEPAEVFNTLLDRLTEKHPCITDLPDEDVDELGVWLDGPLRPVRQEAPVLGLVSDRVSSVLPFVIDTANSLGLTVYDFQTGDVHRPGRKLGNREKTKSERKRLTAARLRRDVDKAMREWLKPLGFEWHKTFEGCCRWRDGYHIFIASGIESYGLHNAARPYSWAGFAETSKIIDHFMRRPDRQRLDSSDDVYIDYGNFVHSWQKGMICDYPEDYERFLKVFRIFILERLLPLLESYSDPQNMIEAYLRKKDFGGLDFDPPIWQGCGSAIRGITLARLYRPRVYKKLKRRYKQQFKEDLRDEHQDRIKRLIAYLDQKELAPID